MPLRASAKLSANGQDMFEVTWRDLRSWKVVVHDLVARSGTPPDPNFGTLRSLQGQSLLLMAGWDPAKSGTDTPCLDASGQDDEERASSEGQVTRLPGCKKEKNHILNHIRLWPCDRGVASEQNSVCPPCP